MSIEFAYSEDEQNSEALLFPQGVNRVDFVLFPYNVPEIIARFGEKPHARYP